MLVVRGISFIFLDSDEYFLGSLVVNKRVDSDKVVYEVIDGQQRLTTLYILLKCLGYEVKNTLNFECREKSNVSLRKLETLEDEDIVEAKVYNNGNDTRLHGKQGFTRFTQGTCIALGYGKRD